MRTFGTSRLLVSMTAVLALTGCGLVERATGTGPDEAARRAPVTTTTTTTSTVPASTTTTTTTTSTVPETTTTVVADDPASSQVAETNAPDPADAISIDELVASESVPSLAWATIDLEAIESGASGVANIELERLATTDTAYALGSVSKPVLAAVVMSLVDDGVLDLDADIASYIDLDVDNPLVDGEVITLRSLMTHTSGIVDNYEVYGQQYRYEGDDHLALDVFLTEYLTPGGDFYSSETNFVASGFSYSNVGAGLVGYVVESVTGLGLDAVARERIFEPLAMTNSGWRLAAFDDVDQVATPYAETAGLLQAIGHVGFPTYPDGGLRSSAHDLARFVAMVAAGGTLDGVEVLSAGAVAEMVDAELYWVRIGDFIGHDGFDPGARAVIMFHREDRFGTVTLTNSDAPAAGRALDNARRLLIAPAGYSSEQGGTTVAPEVASELDGVTGDGAGGVSTAAFRDGNLNIDAAGSMNQASLVPLPGLTSTVVAAAVLQLVDEGTLDLDQPVAEVVSDELARRLDDSVTVGSLLDHSAGLANPDVNLGVDATIEQQLASVDFDSAGPAGGFSVTHNLLALQVLESVSGESAQDVLNQRVFWPSGVVSASLVVTSAEVAALESGVVADAAGQPIPSGEFENGVSPIGNVAMTPADAVTFVQALFDGRLFAAGSDALTQMTPAPTSNDIGLGLWDLTDFFGTPAAGPVGDVAGYQSFIAWTADGSIILAVTANSEFADVGSAVSSL